MNHARAALSAFLLGLGFRCLLLGAIGYQVVGLAVFVACVLAAHSLHAEVKPWLLSAVLFIAASLAGFYAAHYGLSYLR
jgi:hypothetical protein